MTSSARPTIRDVALRAGVSLKTVSRVINDEPNVAAGTAQRVAEAIDALGFHRNDLARTLRHGQRSRTVGLVIEDLANPFYAAIAYAVELAADARGSLLLTTSCAEDPDREQMLVRALLGRRVDALLLAPASDDHRYLAQHMRSGTPVVFLDRPPRELEADTVLLDDHGGARAAVDHLLAHGHRRIACVVDPTSLYTAAERARGYHDALAAAGVSADPALLRADSRDAVATEQTVRELLALPPERRPTAFFCGNNRHTLGALRALRGTQEPVALVGFDDLELADMLALPTTVVRHDSRELGRVAAELAFARLDGDAGPARRTILATELVARGSGEIRPPR